MTQPRNNYKSSQILLCKTLRVQNKFKCFLPNVLSMRWFGKMSLECEKKKTESLIIGTTANEQLYKENPGACPKNFYQRLQDPMLWSHPDDFLILAQITNPRGIRVIEIYRKKCTGNLDTVICAIFERIQVKRAGYCRGRGKKKTCLSYIQ